MKQGLDRRQALWLLAAGCASAPLGQAIVPYVTVPPEWVPGTPVFAATSLVEDGYATGVLVECHDGRPTKIEGNPLHPASFGATGAREQAAIHALYDPDRADALRERSTPRSLPELVTALGDGRGMHLLIEPTSSASMAAALDRVREQRPGIRVHTHAILDGRAPGEGARIAVGEPLLRRFTLDAGPIVSFDANPLDGPWGLRHARALAQRQGRIWSLEAGSSPFGAKADRRLGVRPSEVPAALVALARAFLPGVPEHPVSDEVARFVASAAADLRARPGAVLVGDRWPAWMHGLALAIDEAAGAVPAFSPSPLVDPGADDLDSLLLALDAGEVQTLVAIDGNPVRGPGDLARRFRQAKRVVVAATHADETTAIADWSVPLTHGLERWGDARAHDGTISTIQPVIRPLLPGFAPEEVLAALAGLPLDPRAHTRAAVAPGATDAEWHEILRTGLVAGSASAPVPRAVDRARVLAAIPAPEPAAGLEVTFGPCGRLRDGRWANSPWLQELPDPLTQLAWGNAARLGPRTAQQAGAATGSLLALEKNGRILHVPAVVVPGHPEGVVSLDLGYGRTAGGEVAMGVGSDVDALRSRERPWRDDGIVVSVVGEASLARAQHTETREGRDVAKRGTPAPPEPEARLWPSRGTAKWSMAIDLAACTGCGACAIACQAENNVPTVGPLELAKGRRMHWLRIDRYFDEGGGATFQPMLCQHCEDAPCEYVCPVGASVHSHDGLNEQVYNRCIGTRLCSENCPYKVRKFNWFDYGRDRTANECLQLNPDVTVRERGVMEKCTFCVQRLREGERNARMADRAVTDDDVVPACAQACPSQAITFGLADGPMSERFADPRAYAELAEHGTHPRVRYLAGRAQ